MRMSPPLPSPCSPLPRPCAHPARAATHTLPWMPSHATSLVSLCYAPGQPWEFCPRSGGWVGALARDARALALSAWQLVDPLLK